MKINRYKKVSKHIQFYVNNFNFRQPYQLLIDGTFCYGALNNQVHIADNIPRYLQSELKLLTTQCVIIETEQLGSKLLGALGILKQYALHKCGHEGKPVPGSKCLLSMLGKSNEKHYIIATQDRDLQTKVRKIAGVPLLYLFQKTPVFDPPSVISVEAASKKLGNRFATEHEGVSKLKQKNGILKDDLKPKKRKKKGPNPLSCKKKKKTTGNPTVKKVESNSEIQKKRRKKIRIPKHVKEELLKNVVS